jgi:thiamine pyrophosphate-dependent acetolactate synthase large subunit-like protein
MAQDAAKHSTRSPDRRRFLTGTVVAGAAATVMPPPGVPGSGRAHAQTPKAAPPSAAAMRAESAQPVAYSKMLDGKPGSDFMVDVLRALDIEYVASNPTSSCRGIHESIINYGEPPNKKPEFLTVLHEESGTGMAHGYAKVAGKPMGLLFHGTVGVQHAAMALYNAWCDRVPMIMMCGNHMDAADRLPGVPTTHSAQDPLAIVRDFTKWDDQPVSLQHYAESMVRAYRITMTPPMEPVAISLDGHLQEHAIKKDQKLVIPKLRIPSPPAGEAGAVKELAQMLAGAESPVLVVDRMARTPKGQGLLVELAEILNAAVVDQYGRQNFPNRHFLNQSFRNRTAIGQADVIVGMELTDFWGTVNSFADTPHQVQSPIIKPGTKLASITALDLYIRANYQDFQRFQQVDLAIAADAEATLPLLIEEVRKAMTPEARARAERRGTAYRKTAAEIAERNRANAMLAWDASPISTARMSAELWNVIKDENWALVSRDSQQSAWPHRLWNFDKPHQFIGHSGGAGVGYGLPAAVGASLAHRAHGRLCVNIQQDGDALYAPGALWTSAYHKIPMLSVMHNNRGYHQEVMHVQRMANWRQRGMTRAHIGTEIDNPAPNFAKLADSLGVKSFGPVTDPKDLGPTLRKAVAIVKAGEPVLVDVVSQPR